MASEDASLTAERASQVPASPAAAPVAPPNQSQDPDNDQVAPALATTTATASASDVVSVMQGTSNSMSSVEPSGSVSQEDRMDVDATSNTRDLRPDACTAQEWPLKPIHWPPFSENAVQVNVLMQDANGPCSFLALCNILLLRGDIHLPLHLKSASYATLSSLLADYLLRATASEPANTPILPTNALDFALNVLPKTLEGLDVNVCFLDGTFSRPEGAPEGELELFQLAGVPVRHGWMASRDDGDAWHVLSEHGRDYDTAVNRLVKGDSIAGGSITGNVAGRDAETAARDLAKLFDELDNQPEKQAKVQQAHVIQRFLTGSSTQLTYAGLFHLSEIIPPGSLCALFRNSHFSVLYRRPESLPSPTRANFAMPTLPQPTLFQLVTDQALLHEPGAVWESLEDTDGAASRFWDAALQPARMRDWVAREETSSQERRRKNDAEDADMALAAQLQHDEYEREQHYRDRRTQDHAPSTQRSSEPVGLLGHIASASSESRSPDTNQSQSGPSSGNSDGNQLAGLGVKAKKETDKEKGKKDKKDCVIS